MMFDPPTSDVRWHPMGCQCDDCHPASPADDAEGLVVTTVSTLVLAGMFVAVPIAAAIDALTTQVGLLSVFGS